MLSVRPVAPPEGNRSGTAGPSRISSVESDFSGASPRAGDDEGEDDDYQFSFDPDTKEMVLVEPVATAAKAGIAGDVFMCSPKLCTVAAGNLGELHASP